MKKKYITFNYKKEVEESEIDFEMHSDLKHDYEKEERIEITTRENTIWRGESYPIKIDKMIEMLEEIKSFGCNYAEIMYHNDHIGYIVNGLEIRLSTKEEIKEKEEKILKSQEKWEKIQELRKKIKEIEKE